MLRQLLFTITSVWITLLVSTEYSSPLRPPIQPNIAIDEERKLLGESKLRELERQCEDGSPCWKAAVSQLHASCKELTDMQQSRLAVAFANCHLAKSGRQTYHCDDAMTIEECTRDMNDVAFQTYTEFFTHTGHICYFLQSQLWQERTENVISRLSDSSHEALDKLEESLEYHKVLDLKQNAALNNQEKILDQDRKIADSLQRTREDMGQSFTDMREMAEKQKILLSEMFATLQNSVETIRYLMSLFLVEFVGYETFAFLIVYWLIILFLPKFGYSRFKLHMVLFAEVALEIVFRRIYGYFAFGAAKPPPESLNTLHNWLWNFRYLSLIAGVMVYVWEWLSYRDYELANKQSIDKIQRQMKLLLRHYGIETTEIPEDQPMAHGGPPPPPTHRRASEGLGVGPSMEATPPASVSSPRHSWPNTGGGVEPGVSRGQVGGVFNSSRVMGFAAALNPLQVQVTQSPESTMGRPYHQPTISHSGRKLTIGSDSEPDSGDAVVDSASSTRRFLFSHGHSRHREGSQQPEFERRHSQPYGQREGLPLSPVIQNDSIHSISSLTRHRTYTASTLSIDSDSDADTFVPSDDPMVRQPIRVRPGSSSPSSVKDKNRTTTSKRSSAVSKKPSVSPAAGHRYRGRRSGRDQEGSRYDVGEGGGDWSNLPASNLPEDWGREKEVTEEKQTSTDAESPLPSLSSSPSRSSGGRSITSATTSSGRRHGRGRSRRSEPVVSSTTTTTPAAVSPTSSVVSRPRGRGASGSTTRRRRTLPPPSTPQTRYNLRSRTPSQLPPLNE